MSREKTLPEFKIVRVPAGPNFPNAHINAFLDASGRTFRFPNAGYVMKAKTMRDGETRWVNTDEIVEVHLRSGEKVLYRANKKTARPYKAKKGEVIGKHPGCFTEEMMKDQGLDV